MLWRQTRVKQIRCHVLVALTLVLVFPQVCLPDPVPDNVMAFGLHVSAMGSLDPHFAAGSQDRAVADMIFNGLFRYVPGKAPEIEPDLARTMPVVRMEKGKQIWLIELRKGVFFHAAPGRSPYELTSEDVIYSLTKSADEKFCAYAGAYAGMGFRKIDDTRFEIILDTPVSSILFFPKLTNYGGGFIISKQAMEQLGYDNFAAHPVGTGPFKFKAHIPGRQISLEANKDYFRGPPALDGVVIRFVPDLARREALLRSGELHLITGSGEESWINTMEALPRIEVDTHGVGEVGSVYLNTAMAPMDDVRVRRAIAYALSRRAFAAITSSRISGPVFSQVPSQFLPGGIDEPQARQLEIAYAQDLPQARRLMAEAGFRDGFDLDLVSSEKRIYRRAYDILKEQLAAIGIRCRISVVPHATMHKIIRTAPKPLVIYFAWRPNADAYLTRFFHTDSIVVTGKTPDTNFSHYDKIDPLIEAARFETDPDTQIRLWTQAQIRILSDMAAYPIMFTRQCYARTKALDYGHPLASTMALYPQFTEKTRLMRNMP